MDLTKLIDIGIGLGMLAGTLASGFGAVWLFFRRRLKAWWAPYKAGIAGMGELPALHQAVEGSRKDIIGVRASLNLLTMHVRARSDINIEHAEFEADEKGELTYVNLTFARWLGVGREELLRSAWLNHVHPEDRANVRADWASARADHRAWKSRFRVVDTEEQAFTVEVIVTPIPQEAPARKWIGVLRMVVE